MILILYEMCKRFYHLRCGNSGLPFMCVRLLRRPLHHLRHVTTAFWSLTSPIVWMAWTTWVTWVMMSVALMLLGGFRWPDVVRLWGCEVVLYPKTRLRDGMGCEKLFGQTSLDEPNAFANILCTMGCWYALWSQCEGRCECWICGNEPCDAE